MISYYVHPDFVFDELFRKGLQKFQKTADQVYALGIVAQSVAVFV
jgi:hypothetical protein